MPPLDPLESRILEVVTLAQQNGAHLSVKELMTRRDVSSPSTLHVRLRSMRDKGWILLADTDHRRRKRLEFTPAALRHLDWMGDCLLATAKDVEKIAPVPLVNSETRVARAGNLASGDVAIKSGPPSPVLGWQTGSTGESVELRISVKGSPVLDMVTGEHGFLLDPEQARQIIRDLSAAVLASDVKRRAETGGEGDAVVESREEASG